MSGEILTARDRDVLEAVRARRLRFIKDRGAYEARGRIVAASVVHDLVGRELLTGGLSITPAGSDALEGRNDG